jgi:hypothetical protein
MAHCDGIFADRPLSDYSFLRSQHFDGPFRLRDRIPKKDVVDLHWTSKRTICAGPDLFLGSRLATAIVKRNSRHLLIYGTSLL